MDDLKKDIERIFAGDYKNTLQYATKEFPEEYETIFAEHPSAFETKYEPYPYQKQASIVIDSIYDIHKSSIQNCPPTNLLVASPTGSGKTFAIKWAAHRALETGQRLIVAVPLVALAEQIYFELRQLLSGKEIVSDIQDSMFAEDFDYYDDYYDEGNMMLNSYISKTSNVSSDDESPVGIRTGPSEKFPDAPILVCTYEVVLIQMNQNYRFLDRCPLIIIDEIHMISDPSRGHIPENIMNHPNMPYNTKIIGLSGTLPNSEELAEFMGRTNRTETRIIGAAKRPISLDFYIHTSEEIEEKKDEPPQIFHKVFNSEEKIFDEEKWEEVCQHKRLEHVNANQMKTRILNLIEDLRTSSKLPAMIVGFSCKRLNTLSTYLDSINLCENKRCSSMVHIEFSRMQKTIPKEEWCLFEKFRDLAKRGIGVHHSQNPKHYLEILPKLVKKGYIKVVFATSSLSAGIDLPVRTVVLTDLMMPGPNGFKQIETNLFHQICGRAGRPGLETQGNVVVIQWKKHKIKVRELITTQPKPVSSQYRLTPSTILNILSKDDPDSVINTLVLKSFATKSQNHVSSVLVKCIQMNKKDRSKQVEQLMGAMELLDSIRNDAEQYISKYWKEMKKHFRCKKKIYVDPGKGQIKPLYTTILSVDKDNNTLHTSFGPVQMSWVLYVENASFKKMDFQTFEVYTRLKKTISTLTTMELGEYSQDEYDETKSLMRMKYDMNMLKNELSPETSNLWGEYQKQLGILKTHAFINTNEIPTLKGKMAAGILCPDDPLTLIEFLTTNEYDPDDIVPLLTCFLRKKKHSDTCSNKTYQHMVKLQKQIWTLKNETLGTTMIVPMRLWMSGKSVAHIVQQCDISVGHFCKEALRMKEMLTQITDACHKIGNFELENMVAEQNVKLQRGLPFLQSSFLQ